MVSKKKKTVVRRGWSKGFRLMGRPAAAAAAKSEAVEGIGVYDIIREKASRPYTETS